MTDHADTIRRHYTLVCQCDYADDHDFDERIATSTECVMHGDAADPLYALLVALEELTEAAEETIRALGPYSGAHKGEWIPCLLRLRDAVLAVRRG